MPFFTLLTELRDGVQTITVNRPDKLNALNDQVISELGQAAVEVAANDHIRGVILTGSGAKAFVAGADISELASQSPLEAKERSLAGQAVFRRFEARESR